MQVFLGLTTVGWIVWLFVAAAIIIGTQVWIRNKEDFDDTKKTQLTIGWIIAAVVVGYFLGLGASMMGSGRYRM